MESALGPKGIYAKVQALLESWPPAPGVQGKAAKAFLKEIAEMNLDMYDIMSMEDLAVAIVGSFSHCLERLERDSRHPLISVNARYGARDLLCLLKPLEEKLLPPEGPTNWQIWETFEGAEMQRRQLRVLALYVGFFNVKGDFSGNHGRSEFIPLVYATKKKLVALVTAFDDVQSQLEGHISSDLQSKMTKFTKKLKGESRASVDLMRRRSPCDYQHLFKSVCGSFFFPDRWAKLASEAAGIAQELRSLPNLPLASPKSSEEPSPWSLVEDTATVAEVAAEVAGDVPTDARSVVSCQSVDTQMSYLSGHGGPHCFLPSYLFKHVQSADESASTSVAWVAAKDLRKGAKIESADGDIIEVIKVEPQRTTKLLELKIDNAVPFRTTPNHRIMVPSSDGDDATVKAKDLKVESWVMCTERVAKKVLGIELIPVEAQEVFAITFHPDKAVACFLPPQEPLILTKGLTSKPFRRGSRGKGKGRIRWPDTDEEISGPR